MVLQWHCIYRNGTVVHFNCSAPYCCCTVAVLQCTSCLCRVIEMYSNIEVEFNVFKVLQVYCNQLQV